MGKILFVVPYLSGGGAERVVSIWVNGLKKLNADVELLTFYRVKDEYEISENVCHHTIVETKNEYDLLSLKKKIRLLRNILKRVSPNIVIPFITYVGIMVNFAKVGLNIKIVETVRSDPRTTPSKRLLRLFRNFSILISNYFIVQNNKQLEYFSPFLRKKAKVFFNPIGNIYESVKKENYQSKYKKIIAVGRIEEQKDYFMMIEAIRIVLREYEEVELSIFGEGSLKENLQEYINKNNLENSVYLRGRTQNIINELKESDIYLMSSRWEGMPNSLMEAMAIGLPCISTDCNTGPSDLIDNHKTGILVPVGNSEHLAKEIIRLIENPDHAKVIGKNARKSILKNHSAECSSHELLEFLNNI